MTTFNPAAADIWADLSEGAAHNPEKGEIRTWGGAVEAAVQALETSVTALQAVPTDLDFQGGWDASGGSFPTSTTAGEYWTVETAGTVDGVSFAVNDEVIALVNSASTTTYAANWFKKVGGTITQADLDPLDTASKSGILNTSEHVAATVASVTDVHTNRVTFTDNSGSGTKYVLWDLDTTYTAGETVIVYLKATDNNSDVDIGVGLYDTTTFRVGENSAVADGAFRRYELTVPATRTINRVGVYVIAASAADYDVTVYAVRASDEWALLEDGSVLGGLAKELLDLQSTEFDDYVPEGTAPLGPVDITGVLRAFDAHDGLTNIAGTVKTWQSQDETLALKADALATRPWVNPNGSIFFDDTRYMEASLPIQFVGAHGLPDSTVAPNDNGGYTITGLTRDNRLMWITACDGRENSSDLTYAPSIIILTADGSRIHSEIALSGTFAGIETVQGVAWDSSDDTIWFADAANQKIQHINRSGTDQGDAITLSYTPNGLAYDAANDRLIIGRSSGSTIEIRSASAGTLVSSFDAPTDAAPIDHLHYDGEYIWLTEGANANEGNVWVLTTTGKVVARYLGLDNAYCIEGLYLDAAAGKLYVAVDANFHIPAASKAGAILEYDITPPPTGMAPATLLITALIKRTDTSGGKVIWGFGEPLGGNFGWCLYWHNAANTLRLVTCEAATLKEVRWTVDADETEVLVSLAITDGTSVSLYLNGDSTAETPSSTVGDWTEYPFGFSVAEGALCAEPGGDSAGKQVIYGLIFGDDITEREKAEGFLAHRWSRTDLLDAGHTYKSTAP